MTAAEFWRLHPTEAWWLLEAKMPKKMIGDFTEEEAEALYQDAVRVKREGFR